MADWLSVLILVLVGLTLIYLELIFVPGTTILGLIGLVLTGVGIYITFDSYGTTSGSWVLVGSLAVSIVAVVWSFRQNTWDRFSLKQTNKAKVNPNYTEGLQIEMRGLALSDLKPIGKAEFDYQSYEVSSQGHL